MTPTVVNIVGVKQVGDYCLLLIFDDKSQQIVDFEPFFASSSHPDIRVWLEPDKFSTFRAEHGALIWGAHDLCFPAIDLYLMAWRIGVGARRSL